ncbi:MAG: hypothetical protein Q9208_003877 [Pyrenodesmia sp. 3 TL-2023]
MSSSQVPAFQGLVFRTRRPLTPSPPGGNSLLSEVPSIHPRYAGLPLHQARKLQRRRANKKHRRETNPGMIEPRRQVNHNHNHDQRLARAWLGNECRRADRSGISVAVQAELSVVFSESDQETMAKMAKELSKEAGAALEKFRGQMTKASTRQRGERVGWFPVKGWWEEVQGSGRKARRKMMKERGLLGAGYGEGEDKNEGRVDLGGNEDMDVDKDEYEWGTGPETDDEHGDEDRFSKASA